MEALLKNDPKEVRVIYLARQKNDKALDEIQKIAAINKISIKSSSKKDLDFILPEVNHQGVMAEISASHDQRYNESNLEEFLEQLEEPPILLILDSIQDPHNLGACLRVANAAGVHAVIVPKDKAVGLTGAVHKVSSGASLVTPFFQITNLVRTLKMLKKLDFWIYGTDALAEKTIYETDFKGKIAIVLGGEHDGMRRLTREECDFLVSIPMHGTVPSLNISVAAGICLFEAVRQRA